MEEEEEEEEYLEDEADAPPPKPAAAARYDGCTPAPLIPNTHNKSYCSLRGMRYVELDTAG